MTTTPPGAAPPAATGLSGLDPQLKRLAVVVVLGTIMSILDTTIVNVAIDTLSRDFRAPLSTVQWVSTGYLLALATVIPLTGWAVERFGSKRMWIISLVLFLGGFGLGPNEPVIGVARPHEGSPGHHGSQDRHQTGQR